DGLWPAALDDLRWLIAFGENAARARILGDRAVVDLHLRQQRASCGVRFTLRGEHPQQPPILGPILWERDLEHEPLTADDKMRRLSAVKRCRLTVVVGPDRDVELLLEVAIEVPEDHADGAVGRLLPALEDWRGVLARGISDLRAGGVCRHHE